MTSRLYDECLVHAMAYLGWTQRAALASCVPAKYTNTRSAQGPIGGCTCSQRQIEEKSAV